MLKNHLYHLKFLCVLFLVIMLFSGCTARDCSSSGGDDKSPCSISAVKSTDSVVSVPTEEPAGTDTNALLAELEEMAFFPASTDTNVTESALVAEKPLSTVSETEEVVSVDNSQLATIITNNVAENAALLPAAIKAVDNSALSFSGLEFSGNGNIEPLQEEAITEPVYDDYIKFPERYAVISDSNHSDEQAITNKLHPECPQSIVKDQRVLRVVYHAFDGKVHSGQIVIHHKLLSDVEGFFRLAFELNFPIESVIPISDPRFGWDDTKSMAANNSSGFNYRKVINTDRLSKHATGQAFDVNTRLNPWFHKPGSVLPAGASYDTSKPGTFSAKHKLVEFLKKRGWFWGGDWINKDCHHFQKDI